MPVYFVDGINGSDSNDGLTMDTAWGTLEKAFATAVAPDTQVWVRRASVTTGSVSIANAGQLGHTKLIEFIGWPRPARAFAAGEWTQGSRVVVTEDPLRLLAHAARYVTCPDGMVRMVRLAEDAGALQFELDRVYSGPSVSGAAGAFTLHEDSDYARSRLIDDSAWTIKKVDWDADEDDLPGVYFAAGNHGSNATYSGLRYANLFFSSEASYGPGLWFNGGVGLFAEGIINIQATAGYALRAANGAQVSVKRSIYRAVQTDGWPAVGVDGPGQLRLLDVDFQVGGTYYSYWLGMDGFVHAENVGVGLDASRGWAPAMGYMIHAARGRLTGAGLEIRNADTAWNIFRPMGADPGATVSIDDWQRINGNILSNRYKGAVTRVASASLAAEPPSGAENVLQLRPTKRADNPAGAPQNHPGEDHVDTNYGDALFKHRLYCEAGSFTLDVYIHSPDIAIPSGKAVLVVSGPLGSSDGSGNWRREYTAAILQTSDWTQKISAAFDAPIAGWVSARLFIFKSEEGDQYSIDKIYIDPFPVLS